MFARGTRFAAAAASLASVTWATPGLGAATYNQLSYIPGSTIKIEQILGDHDWADTSRTVRSTTLTHADVLGSDIGASFMDGDSLIFLCGDTIGATQTYVPTWARTLDLYKWDARDPLAWSTTANSDSALDVQFFTNAAGDSTLITAPVYADGSSLPMGIDDVADAGITLAGKIDLVCKTGANEAAGSAVNDSDSSVVVRFHPQIKTFTAHRTMSRLRDGGRFITTSLCALPAQFASSPSDSEVLIFGLGKFRDSDVYLSMIPAADFETGTDAHGASATRYFTGLTDSIATWSSVETDAVPIVRDDPHAEIGIGPVQSPWPNDTPTIGNVSVLWSPALNLWLMTFDGGRQAPSAKQTSGVYFSYALAPWGPWFTPQHIFNATDDHALGAYIRQWNSATMTGSGPAGPTIGDQAKNDPDTTAGGNYAPYILAPFLHVVGDTLILDYTLSTWNPYTIVRMRSKFLVTPKLVGVEGTPEGMSGIAARPNPFRVTTRVAFSLARGGQVDAAVFDVSGRRVCRLARGAFTAGAHALAWDGRGDDGLRAASGVYFVRVRAAGGALVTRVVRLD
jgi:hypothetical protein